MKYLAGMIMIAALASVPAVAEEAEYGPSLALLQTSAASGSIPGDRAEAERGAALIKEGEAESPETLALIERNREDRERAVVMDQ